MNDPYFDRLAMLLLYSVNFTKGDKILVNIDYDCREVARHVAEQAYAGGARYVEVEYRNQFLEAAAIRGIAKEIWFPEHLRTRESETVQAGWKRIAIRSNAEGDVFEGLSPERSSAYFRAKRAVMAPSRKATMANRIPWTVTYIPSAYLARLAFPDLEVEEGMQRYWAAVVDIMHLDRDDPREVWHQKMLADEKRSRFMNDLNPIELHFTGPGTDLTVGLNENARWIGGYDVTTSGERFIANIPTEEIFTSPDFRRVEGTVRLTRPFVMHQNLGPIPRDAWFEFKGGRVVDFGAAEGKETLAAFFDIDERGRYAGEIALVDPKSPIAATGMTYYNGLHDENSACHLAFGKAYPSTLSEQRDYSDEELLGMGMNVALVHEDAMIGGLDVDVTAILRDGSRREIINGGTYRI